MNKIKLAEAITTLIKCRNFADRIEAIRHGTHALTGHDKVYLPLRDMTQRQPEQFNRVIQYCAEKRVVKPTRNEYQKQLMRERRARMAAMLAKLERKHGTAFTKDQRERLTLLVHAQWATRRAAYIAEHGSHNENIAQFWAEIDKELGL